MYVYPAMRQYLADGDNAVEHDIEEHKEFERTMKAGKVELAKKLAPTRPHPGAPNSELFHELAGPGVGMVDRLRDNMTGRATR
jgi:hypothetical protein